MIKNKLIKSVMVGILSVSLLFSSGCASLKSNPDKLATAKILVQSTAMIGANHLILSDPKNGRAYLVLVSTTLDSFLLSDTLDAVALSVALQNVPIKELKNSLVAEFTPIVVAVYALATDNALKDGLKKNVVALELLKSLKSGIDNAVAANK